VDKAKPFDIPKREVWEAFKKVKANRGAAGVDGQTVADFEADLSNNLYKLWNRMSSGSYFPPPVRRVDIPKGDSKTETRPLGIPTVADRIAQEVVKRYLEPVLEPIFHRDSYGYRPGRSAIDAVRTARQRCWRYDWTLDIDVKGYFDSIDWELLLKAVRKHTGCPWVLLYIERWLKIPAQMEDGSVVPRAAGTPQGGGCKPLPRESVFALCFRHVDGENLSCHPVREIRGRHHLPLPKRGRGTGVMGCPGGPVCGLQACSAPAEDKARLLQGHEPAGRLSEPIIRLSRLRVSAEEGSVARRSIRRFVPACGSPKALKAIRQAIRGWAMHRRSDKTLDDLARMFNPYIRGWINYYSHFYRSALYWTLNRVDAVLVRWACDKFKRLRRKPRRARDWLARVRRASPNLFAHWRFVHVDDRTSGAV
jgi:RNA-directed DNA polymerase